MNDPMYDHRIIGNVGVLFLAVVFAVLGWVQNHPMMRQGLFAAATWVGGVFTMRCLNEMGIGTASQARLFNGWFAWVVLSMLAAALLTQWIVDRRHRND